MPEDRTPLSPQASLPPLPEAEPVTKDMPAQLPLGAARGIRVILEGSDLAAAEAAAAEMKVRFGSRFSVTGRRLSPDRQTLRFAAGLIANLDAAMDTPGMAPGKGDDRHRGG